MRFVVGGHYLRDLCGNICVYIAVAAFRNGEGSRHRSSALASSGGRGNYPPGMDHSAVAYYSRWRKASSPISSRTPREPLRAGRASHVRSGCSFSRLGGKTGAAVSQNYPRETFPRYNPTMTFQMYLAQKDERRYSPSRATRARI